MWVMQYYTWRRQAERKPPCQRTIKPKNAYEFNIDGVSHVNWFKRKKDEFMEALGMPAKRQNRGIKL